MWHHLDANQRPFVIILYDFRHLLIFGLLGPSKGTFLSESTGGFVLTPNRLTFFFPETENSNFGDFYGCPSQLQMAVLPLQASKYSNFNISSISKQFSVSGKKKCLFALSYDKNISTF